ncbi:MAG: signal peptidase I [Roseburia sp.]|nr:signal peptidase I [Roseburia sp.]
MNTEGMDTTPQEQTDEPKKRSRLSYAVEFIIYIALILLCVFWVPEHVIQRTVVKGESMEETLHDEESLLVNKLSFYEPSRYDIVVFYPQGEDVDEYYVKRIYGLPGETIQIVGNDILINGEKIEDSYAKNPMDDSGIAAEPLKLADDEYFVLGDNREVSLDSRDPDVGPVKKKNLAGHVVLRIWPLSKFGKP